MVLFRLSLGFVLLLCMGLSPLLAQDHWTRVSAGAEFSLGLRSDGTLWSWGFNGSGQLGVGAASATPVTAPVRAGEDSDWSDISAGAVHVIALKADGTLWAWGGNGVNQLGDQTIVDRAAPVHIAQGEHWKSIAAGQAHNLAIHEDGTLWAWGYNAFGQVGDGTIVNRDRPVRISEETDWSQVTAGGYHSLAIKEDGSLWVWGANFNGQLGKGNTDQSLAPAPVSQPVGQWVSVSAGFEYSIGMQSDGTIWSWGFNGNGQLGIGNTTEQLSPVQIGTGSDWTYIAAGSSYAFGIRADSTLWAWGANIEGSCGLPGPAGSVVQPTQVGLDTDWTSVSPAKGILSNGFVYGLHSLGLHGTAQVICVTGANYVGQIGTGDLLTLNGFECTAGQITVSVMEKITGQLSVFPNPVHEYVYVDLPDGKAYNWTCESTDGRVLQSGVHNGEPRLAVLMTAVPAGVYILRLRSTEAEYVQKIIKQ